MMNGAPNPQVFLRVRLAAYAVHEQNRRPAHHTMPANGVHKTPFSFVSRESTSHGRTVMRSVLGIDVEKTREKATTLRGRRGVRQPALPIAPSPLCPPDLVTCGNVSAVVAYCSHSAPWTAARMTRPRRLAKIPNGSCPRRVAADLAAGYLENARSRISETRRQDYPSPRVKQDGASYG